MQLLTTSGYKNIEDCQIGEELIAYEVGTGQVIINQLLGKEWFSPEMFEDVYSEPEQAIDEDGNPLFEQVPVLDEEGNAVLDEEGNPVFENGEPIMTEPVLLQTKKQVFEEVYGDLTFRKVNDKWNLFKNQSIWANLRVVHALDLQIGDTIYNDKDEDVEVTSLVDYEAEGWWRLSVSGDHSYISDDLTLHNASRYWVGGGSSANWNATGNTNWGSTSGGANNASVPTSADDVTFDGAGANGNDNSTISATITILSLDMQTGYTATMTHNAVLTIAGNWTFRNTYTIAGASGITISAASTITSNGTTWPNNLTFTGASTTKTLLGDLTINRLFATTGGTSGAAIINATTNEILYLNGGLSIVGNISGTAAIYLQGGTWSASTTAGQLTNILYINGNVTVSGSVSKSTGSITYLSGTVTTTGSTLNIGTSIGLDTNGITWNNINMSSGTPTLTLLSNLSINGVFSVNTSFSTTITPSASQTVTIAGGLTLNQGLAGTAKIILTGGTWSGNNGFSSNCDIQGNVTISGTVQRSGGTLTYVSGTVTTTGSTLNIAASCTLNTNGIQWNNISLGANITLTSDLYIGGSILLTGGRIVNKTTSEIVELYGGVALSVNLNIQGTAPFYLKGGSYSVNGTSINNHGFISNPVFIDGNLSGNLCANSNTVTYVSGVGGTLSLFTDGCTLDTGPYLWRSLVRVGGNPTTVTIISDFNILNLTSSTSFPSNSPFTTIINTSNNSVVNVYNSISLNYGNIGGGATINFLSGIWDSPSYSISNDINIYQDAAIVNAIFSSTRTITIIQSNNRSINGSLSITAGATLIGMNRCPLKTVNITAGQTLTVDQLPTGTAENICQITSTGANYTIAFQDGFEKLGHNVAVSGATIANRGQLILTRSPRFTTNRGTNIGVRYINQSPNGFAVNKPSINDTMTVPALGLVSDPNFLKQ